MKTVGEGRPLETRPMRACRAGLTPVGGVWVAIQGLIGKGQEGREGAPKQGLPWPLCGGSTDKASTARSPWGLSAPPCGIGRSSVTEPFHHGLGMCIQGDRTSPAHPWATPASSCLDSSCLYSLLASTPTSNPPVGG